MIDWEAALSVALTGLISVFLVLGIMSAAVTICGNVVDKFASKKSTGVEVQK